MSSDDRQLVQHTPCDQDHARAAAKASGLLYMTGTTEHGDFLALPTQPKTLLLRVYASEWDAYCTAYLARMAESGTPVNIEQHHECIPTYSDVAIMPSEMIGNAEAMPASDFQRLAA